MAKLEVEITVKFTIWYWITMLCVRVRWYKAFTIFSIKNIAKIYVNDKFVKHINLFELKDYESQGVR